jgi:hypothetical protein
MVSINTMRYLISPTSPKTSRIEVDIVIRGHSSKCLIACNQRIDEITMPELIEALAARSVVALVREEGLINIILASNRLSFCGSVH